MPCKAKSTRPERLAMEEGFHKPGLYKWKRQSNPRVHSRTQKVTTNDDVHNWIKKVEDASNRAAEEVFGINSALAGRERGRATALATVQQLREHDEIHSEAQELLSQWMSDKVHLDDESLDYVDDPWHQRAVETDVKREWDHLLESNYDEYGLEFTPRVKKKAQKKDSLEFHGEVDEDLAVSSIIQNMLQKNFVREEFTKDLGLDKGANHKDPRTKMELRHQQVKENRERKQKDLEKRYREAQSKKEAQVKAKQMILKEDRDNALRLQREEEEIRKEMAKIRKEMQEEKKKMEECQSREKRQREEIQIQAWEQVNGEHEMERMQHADFRQREEEKQRKLKAQIHQFQAKKASTNVMILQKHFSAWYHIVLEKRLQTGRARAMADWRLLLRSWNGWRSYVRSKKLDRETKQHEINLIRTQRYGRMADRHHRTSILRKCFVAWQLWVQQELERKDLEHAQETTRSKMMALLEKAATGKLWNEEEKQSKNINKADGTPKPGTAEEFEAFFSQPAHRPISSNSFGASTARSVSTVSGRTERISPSRNESRIPTQAWQVTRKHLKLTNEEIAGLAGGEPGELQEQTDLKVRKRFGMQPWMNTAYTVNNFENRYKSQQKVLTEQQNQLKEQQRKIEELQYQQNRQLLMQQATEAQELQGQLDKQQRLQKQLNNLADVPSVPGGQVEGQQHNKVIKDKRTNVDQATISAGSMTQRSSGSVSARSEVSGTTVTEASTATSTVKSNAKYLSQLQKMEERAAERTRLKAERDEKRRKAEEDRLHVIQEEEERRLKQEQEDKKGKIEAYREKKRLEKQKELEKQERENRMRELTQMADHHYIRSIMKYRGLLSFKKLVSMARQNDVAAKEHYTKSLLRHVFLAWHHHVRETVADKEVLADEMFNFMVIKRCFRNWRKHKFQMRIQEEKARRHYEWQMKSKIIRIWADYAMEEKLASWDKERKAKEHYIWLLQKRSFKRWRTFPEERKKEQGREKRREELRKKVASLLPDYEGIARESKDELS